MDVLKYWKLQIIFYVHLVHTRQTLQSFNPEIQMPYEKISGSSTPEINKIGSTLTCNDERSSLKDCATECFNRSLDTGCPGFFWDTSQTNVCHLCHVSNITEVQGSSFTTFESNDVVYLLKSKPVKPEVSMNFDSHNGNTIPGTGTEGTTTNVVEDDFVSGIKGTGLYLHDGGKVAMTGSSTECWTNLQNCTSGMTVSMWFKPTNLNHGHSFIVGSGGNRLNSFSFYLHGHSRKPQMVAYLPEGRYYAVAISLLTLNQWSLISGTYHPDHGTTISMNGVYEHAHTAPDGYVEAVDSDSRGHIGVKDAPPYSQEHITGEVDEFKLFYRVLNSVGMYKINKNIFWEILHVSLNQVICGCSQK